VAEGVDQLTVAEEAPQLGVRWAGAADPSGVEVAVDYLLRANYFLRRHPRQRKAYRSSS